MGDLFGRAVRGEAQAQEELHRIIRRIARAISAAGGPGGVDVDWEDIAQEASQRFFTVGIHQYRGTGSEESFLFGIVRSTLLMAVRAATRRRSRERNALPDENAHASIRDQELDVRMILARLTPECARLLEQAFLQDVPYPVLASAMGMQETAVRVRVSRCLKKAMEIAGEVSR